MQRFKRLYEDISVNLHIDILRYYITYNKIRFPVLREKCFFYLLLQIYKYNCSLSSRLT